MKPLTRRMKELRDMVVVEDTLVTLVNPDGTETVVRQSAIDKAFFDFMDAAREHKPIPALARQIGLCIASSEPRFTGMLRMLVRAYFEYQENEDLEAGI